MVFAHAGETHDSSSPEWVLAAVAIGLIVSVFGLAVLAHADKKAKPKKRKSRKK